MGGGFYFSDNPSLCPLFLSVFPLHLLFILPLPNSPTSHLAVPNPIHISPLISHLSHRSPLTAHLSLYSCHQGRAPTPEATDGGSNQRAGPASPQHEKVGEERACQQVTYEPGSSPPLLPHTLSLSHTLFTLTTIHLRSQKHKHEGLTAFDVVNTFPEGKLADILWRFGEERRSRKIARAIVARREGAYSVCCVRVCRAYAVRGTWVLLRIYIRAYTC